MKLIKFAIYITFFIFLLSCNKTTGPILPDVTTTEVELANFQTILADYDSIVFKNNDDLLLSKKDVVEIILGSKDGGTFEEILSIVPVYNMVGEKFLLQFEISDTVNRSVYIKRYIIRFVMTDDSFFEFDNPIHFYQYPYENTQIFLPYDPGPNGDIVDIIQDFDIVGDFLYYHPYAAFGLFRYNMKTGETKDLLNYGSGDHIASADNYIFCDIDHHHISRYDLLADSVDIRFDMQQIEFCHDRDSNLYCSNLSIYGLAAGNNVAYVLIMDYSDENLYLAQFDYEGNYLESVLWTEEYPYNLEYYDGVLYSYKYFFGEDEILRFDLNSMSFLESKPLPSVSPDGISIVNGRFYYSDYYRQIICSIPMFDLMD